MKRTLALALAPLGLMACGGTLVATHAFEMSFPDNDPAALRATLPHLVRRTMPDADLAVGVSMDGQLVAFRPSTGEVQYRVATSTTLPIHVAGRRIVVEEAGRVRILDAANGRETARLPLLGGAEPEHVIGADEDAGLLALTLAIGGGTTTRARLVTFERDGLSEEVVLDRPIGVPTVTGRHVLVPWGYQHLSVLDDDGGEEVRMRFRTDLVGHAFASTDGVWFGGPSLYRLNAESAHETPSGYSPPALPVDQLPHLLPNAYDPPPPLTSAAHHIRLVAAPAASGVVPADGALYLVHYRFVFGLEAATGVPRWVRALPTDIVGASAFRGGVRVVGEGGESLVLDAATGRAHASATVSDRLRFVAYPRAVDVALGEAVEGERPDVRVQLLEAVQVSDARLVTGREFALGRLALLADDDATADLGLLCEDDSLPARTREKACDLLSTRPVGADHVRAQLARHGSFLDERPHPPVAALARAAGTMRDREAVPLLLEQLDDPRTTPMALSTVAEALLAIGDPACTEALRRFLRLYHGDLSEPGLEGAYGAVANTYVRLGGDPALAELDALAGEPLASAAAVRILRESTLRFRAERNQAAAAAQAAAVARGDAAAPPPPPPLPGHVTMDLAQPVLAEAQDDLARCLDADPARSGSARVIVVIRRNGSVEDVQAVPHAVAPCLRNRMGTLRFPETRGRGDTTRLTFTLRATP